MQNIYIEKGNHFAAYLNNWTAEKGISTHEVELRSEDLMEQADSLVIFHENHNIAKEYSDLRELFDSKHMPVHKIDINGTMVVALSQFQLWLERNKCRNLLILGASELKDNPNIERFFKELELA